jgi:hypothetical protein
LFLKRWSAEFAALVYIGLYVIESCARIVDVRPRLEDQTKRAVYLYIDPQDNSTEHIIIAVSIIERLDPRNDIHKQLFAEPFLKKIGYIIDTLDYQAEHNRHQVSCQNEEQGKGASVELKNYLLCLLLLVKHGEYCCILLSQMEKHQDKLEMVLSNGNDLEVERMKRFLQLLAGHKCSNCSSTFLVRLLLQYGTHLETSSAPKHGQLLSGGISFPCKYMAQCHSFLETLNVKGKLCETVMDI